MGGIDRFISNSFTNQIKKQLPKNQLRELERKLFLDEGMSVKLSIEYFDILHNKIKEIQNADSLIFEKMCLEKILKVKNSKNSFKIKIIDKKLIEKILESFGDAEIKEFLLLLMNNSKTIPEMLEKVNVSKTSAYRKIENLIHDGIIIETGRVRSQSKLVLKYRFIFDELTIQLKDNSIFVEGIMTKEHFQESSIFKKINYLI